LLKGIEVVYMRLSEGLKDEYSSGRSSEEEPERFSLRTTREGRIASDKPEYKR
jgi:hypothetical protein